MIRISLSVVLLIIYSCNYCQSECVIVPNECPNPNITFWLYTRANKEGIEINADDINQINKLTEKPRPITFLIHGFTSNKDDKFNIDTRTELLKKKDLNVISIDWSPITPRRCREESSLNTRVVGNCTAYFIDKLVQQRNDIAILEDIHVIGFSLGAQITAFISSNMKLGNLAHITGLDPTLPYFDTDDLSQRLSPDDADFVDVYHTSAGTRGQIIPCGHIDTYFNDGADQPGCQLLDDDEEKPHQCSHTHAPAYYAESINAKANKFYARKCYFKNNLPLNDCTKERLKVVGYPVTKESRGVYQVNTNACPPYAQGMLGIETVCKN